MNDIRYHRKFKKDFRKLPAVIQKKLIELEDIFRENPFDPVLYTKKLQGKLQDVYSSRITRDYRVIFQFVSREEILVLAVKHRQEIYQ